MFKKNNIYTLASKLILMSTYLGTNAVAGESNNCIYLIFDRLGGSMIIFKKSSIILDKSSTLVSNSLTKINNNNNDNKSGEDAYKLQSLLSNHIVYLLC